jgi:hypothetical protein
MKLQAGESWEYRMYPGLLAEPLAAARTEIPLPPKMSFPVR